MPLREGVGNSIHIKCKYVASVPRGCPVKGKGKDKGPEGGVGMPKTTFTFFITQQRASLSRAGQRPRSVLPLKKRVSQLSLGSGHDILMTTIGYIHDIPKLETT